MVKLCTIIQSFVEDQDVRRAHRWVIICRPSGNDGYAFLMLIRYVVGVDVGCAICVTQDDEVLS
jgi:hypothetical protein